MDVTDERRRTKGGKLLKAEFRKALMEKGIRKISVKELCRSAGLNRSTFYENYASLQDLLYEVQRDYFRNIFTMLPPGVSFASTAPAEDRLAVMRIVLKYHTEHRDELFALLDNNSAGDFETNISLFLKREILPPDCSKLDEYEFTYHFMGNLTAVITWLRENRACDEEAFASFLAGFGIRGGTDPRSGQHHGY